MKIGNNGLCKTCRVPQGAKTVLNDIFFFRNATLRLKTKQRNQRPQHLEYEKTRFSVKKSDIFSGISSSRLFGAERRERVIQSHVAAPSRRTEGQHSGCSPSARFVRDGHEILKGSKSRELREPRMESIVLLLDFFQRPLTGSK